MGTCRKRTSQCEFSIVSESIHFAFYSLFVDYSLGKKADERSFNIDEQYSLNMHIVGEIGKFNANLTESGLPRSLVRSI